MVWHRPSSSWRRLTSRSGCWQEINKVINPKTWIRFSHLADQPHYRHLHSQWVQQVASSVLKDTFVNVVSRDFIQKLQRTLATPVTCCERRWPMSSSSLQTHMRKWGRNSGNNSFTSVKHRIYSSICLMTFLRISINVLSLWLQQWCHQPQGGALRWLTGHMSMRDCCCSVHFLMQATEMRFWQILFISAVRLWYPQSDIHLGYSEWAVTAPWWTLQACQHSSQTLRWCAQHVGVSNCRLFVCSLSCPIREARMKMRPESGEDASFISDSILGNEPKVVHDEFVSGDYGLVINGHSLVRHMYTFYNIIV